MGQLADRNGNVLLLEVTSSHSNQPGLFPRLVFFSNSFPVLFNLDYNILADTPLNAA